MFKSGIPRRLLYTILRRDQIPHTINEWQISLRDEFRRQQMIDATLGPRSYDTTPIRKDRPNRWQKNRQQSRRDPNAMDVDTAVVDTAETRRTSERLSEDEKKKRRAEGRCFTCGKQGHISRACPKRRDGGKAKGARRAEIRDQQNEAETEENNEPSGAPPTYDQDALYTQIRAMTTEQRDEFLDQMIMAEEGF